MMMNCDLRFSVGFDMNALSLGVRIPLYIDFSSVPHLLIVAPSGAGKTHLLTIILKQFAQKPVILLLADFKGIDFTKMEGCTHYYRHRAVADALSLAFDTLQKRMSNPDEDRTPLILCFDEWSGFLSLYGKKDQENFKQMMASILMLGRGVGVFVIMALQRADASYITGRDNFGNAIGLGRLSAESVRMLFPDEAAQIEPQSRGQGYLRTDGKPLQKIVVPQIRSTKKARSIIINMLR